jgi:hypothetical protein
LQGGFGGLGVDDRIESFLCTLAFFVKIYGICY